MANRNFPNSRIYTGHIMPVLIDCNFIVDSTNANNLGIRSLKGPYVQSVTMQALSGGGGFPPGSPNLATSASYAVLAASAISNTGSSVLTGDLGLFPGTSVTGFPPGTVIGTQHITDSFASQAELDALAAYNELRSRPSTTIPAILDGQTLSAGVYSEASGTFNLAASGNGTLTLNGSATDIFVFNAASTVVTGAGGIPTIALTGGALASNVYWTAGSSATLNVSGSGVFEGTMIAQASVTIDGGSAQGRLFALTGAVTISAATAITVIGPSGPTHVAGTPGPGTIVVRLQDAYNRLYTGGHAIVSPVSGTALKIDNSALTAGVAYIISTLGSSTAAQWHALGVPAGVTPAVGVAFIASSVGAGANSSTSRVMATAAAGSSVASIETVGDANLSANPNPSANQGFGAQIILQTRTYGGAIAAPVDGSVISLSFLLSNSSILVQGE